MKLRNNIRTFSKIVLPNKVWEYISGLLITRIMFSPNPSKTIIYLFELLFSPNIRLDFKERRYILKKFLEINKHINCGHSFDELLIPAIKILESDKRGCIVEVGTWYGGGASKLSVIAKICNRKLYVFDSFKGLPKNNEPIQNTTLNYYATFNEGEMAVNLKKVKENIKRYGNISVCKFIKGYFKDTIPSFNEKVFVVFSDVDLECSNKTCIKYLWNNLVNGGYYFSQDYHIPIVKELFLNNDFWKREVGINKPEFIKCSKRFGYFKKDQQPKGEK